MVSKNSPIDAVREFEDKFGNNFNIVMLTLERALVLDKGNKELLQMKEYLGKMKEDYFKFLETIDTK